MNIENTSTCLTEQRLEIFKLDEIDRRVFFWLVDHVPAKSIRCWIEYIAMEYRRKRIYVNVERLFGEAVELMEEVRQVGHLKVE